MARGGPSRPYGVCDAPGSPRRWSGCMNSGGRLCLCITTSGHMDLGRQAGGGVSAPWSAGGVGAAVRDPHSHVVGDSACRLAPGVAARSLAIGSTTSLAAMSGAAVSRPPSPGWRGRGDEVGVHRQGLGQGVHPEGLRGHLRALRERALGRTSPPLPHASGEFARWSPALAPLVGARARPCCPGSRTRRCARPVVRVGHAFSKEDCWRLSSSQSSVRHARRRYAPCFYALLSPGQHAQTMGRRDSPAARLQGARHAACARAPLVASGYTCIHVCMCRCVHAFTCACTRVYMRVCILVHVFSCIHVYVYTCIHVNLHTCIHGYIHMCMNVCMRICLQMCMYTRACIGKYMNGVYTPRQ